jgi:hypothetical protein
MRLVVNLKWHVAEIFSWLSNGKKKNSTRVAHFTALSAQATSQKIIMFYLFT